MGILQRLARRSKTGTVVGPSGENYGYLAPVEDSDKIISDVGGLPVDPKYLAIQNGLRKDVRPEMGEYDEGPQIQDCEFFVIMPEWYGFMQFPPPVYPPKVG